MQLYGILFTSAVLIWMSAVTSAPIPSCLMPCKPSSDPKIPESSLHYTITHSINSMHLSSKLNGVRGELKIIVRTKSKYYSSLVEVKDLQVDEVHEFISKIPEFIWDESTKEILFVKFRGLPRITVYIQQSTCNSISDEFGLLDKINSLQNQLKTVENTFKIEESRYNKTQMQNKLKICHLNSNS